MRVLVGHILPYCRNCKSCHSKNASLQRSDHRAESCLKNSIKMLSKRSRYIAKCEQNCVLSVLRQDEVVLGRLSVR